MTNAKNRAPVLTLLTDFGKSDHYVAAMKGVILRTCPSVQMVDICHQVEPYDISGAAYTLQQAWTCFPEDTVHLVVVDPGVGSSRRPILASVGTHHFVAPDNGVLGMVLSEADRHAREYTVREITAEKYFRQSVSKTFHGRDIFAPVAAHLANGVPAAEIGAMVEDVVRPAFGTLVQMSNRSWSGTVLKIDHFGNVITNFPVDDFPVSNGRFWLQVGSAVISRFAGFYAQMAPDELFVIAGSAGYLEVSLNGDNAAFKLGVRAGAPLELHL